MAIATKQWPSHRKTEEKPARSPGRLGLATLRAWEELGVLAPWWAWAAGLERETAPTSCASYAVAV